MKYAVFSGWAATWKYRIFPSDVVRDVRFPPISFRPKEFCGERRFLSPFVSGPESCRVVYVPAAAFHFQLAPEV